MESKSWPARGERGAPTRCWQDREMPRPLGEADWTVRGASNGTVVGRATPSDPAPRSRPERAENGCPKNIRPCACAAAARWSRPNVRWWRSQPSAVRPDTGAFSGHEKGRGTDEPHDLGSLGSTHLATENKPVTKGHVFPDSIYHEKSTRGKSVERRVEEGLSGAGRPGGKGMSQLKGTRFIFEVVKMS